MSDLSWRMSQAVRCAHLFLTDIVHHVAGHDVHTNTFVSFMKERKKAFPWESLPAEMETGIILRREFSKIFKFVPGFFLTFFEFFFGFRFSGFVGF